MITPNKIVIVGGGSAGWMVASSLISEFPEKEITVIEPVDIPKVGVGESTVGGIRLWLKHIGLSDEEFMKECDASYKLAIKFTNFYKEDSGSWFYPFSQLNIDNPEFTKNDWFILKAIDPDIKLSSYTEYYYPQQSLINENKIAEDYFNFKLDEQSAFHFDSIKFGNFLKRKYCIPRGVNLISGSIKDISLDDSGIKKLILDNGLEVSADLYIDCTGFKSLLLDKTIKEPFINLEEFLPNNRAWATKIDYLDKEKELEPFTECTAVDYGWVWNIPLWSRIGTGFVYNDNITEPKKALELFKKYLIKKGRDPEALEYKDIKMRVGTHKNHWVKNVIAIGLSACFIEPLESTGLITVHESAMRLCKTLRRGHVSAWDIKEYNSSVLDDFLYFVQFVNMHYELSHRNNTEYWKNINDRICQIEEYIKSSLGSLPITIQASWNRAYLNTIQDDTGLLCLTAGMNWNPVDKILLSQNAPLNANLKDYHINLIKRMEFIKDRYNKNTSESSSLYQFLNDKIYKND